MWIESFDFLAICLLFLIPSRSKNHHFPWAILQVLTQVHGWQVDNAKRDECRIFISVITARGSFLYVRFDVVQIGRPAITPGQLYRWEGLSENAD